ncbi:hypothetical protein TEQG_06333 [Trichophyton equinum CBS 127.97]|uniref:Uncharacterized protein n=1 Tax=Trichophyton equinum (strain ATCC MYA-4606 / CBS 127.97) TaxID=559882 RepID=F2PZE2_TRIEC|nr:hypothetical protein TEQG_06333 [Trichophyton equinum CBS 127.97]
MPHDSVVSLIDIRPRDPRDLSNKSTSSSGGDGFRRFTWRRRNIAERDLDLARRRLPGDGEPDRPGSVIDQRDRGRPSFDKHSMCTIGVPEAHQGQAVFF